MDFFEFGHSVNKQFVLCVCVCVPDGIYHPCTNLFNIHTHIFKYWKRRLVIAIIIIAAVVLRQKKRNETNRHTHTHTPNTFALFEWPWKRRCFVFFLLFLFIYSTIYDFFLEYYLSLHRTKCSGFDISVCFAIHLGSESINHRQIWSVSFPIFIFVSTFFLVFDELHEMPFDVFRIFLYFQQLLSLVVRFLCVNRKTL